MNGWQALVRDEAIGRADTLAAVLQMSPTPTDDDIDWATTAARSLAGLGARLGVDADAVVAGLDHLRRTAPADRGDGRDRLLAALTATRADLVALGSAVVPETLKLAEIAASARAEAERLATTLGIPIVAEVVLREGTSVGRRVAGAIVDAIALVLGHMAAHGCVRGGSVRVEVRRDGELVAVTLGDRGNAESREVPDAVAGPELAAAASRMTALGGEIAVSAAPWGGTSVVIKVRDRTGLGHADVRRRG